MRDTRVSDLALAKMILAMDATALSGEQWMDLRRRAQAILDNEDYVAIPKVPDQDILVAMAKVFDPAFDMDPTQIGASIVGLNDADRRQIIAKMAQVYRSLSSMGDVVPSESVVEPQEAEISVEQWWRRLSGKSLEIFLQRLGGMETHHWRPGAHPGSLANSTAPLVVRNDRIGPVIVERAGEGRRLGLYPYIGDGYVADESSWYIPLSTLDRWMLAPLPESARGWHELFSPSGSPPPSGERIEAIERVLALLRAFVADDLASTEEQARVIEMFFDALKDGQSPR